MSGGRSPLPRGLKLASTVASLLGLWVPITQRHACLSLVRVVCSLVCVGLITRPDASYWVWCVGLWSWSSLMKRPWPTRSCCAMGTEKNLQVRSTLWSPQFHNFLYPTITSSILHQNILPRTLLSNIPNLCFSFNLRSQVSHMRRENKIDPPIILMTCVWYIWRFKAARIPKIFSDQDTWNAYGCF